jgi:hypothetical protein
VCSNAEAMFVVKPSRQARMKSTEQRRKISSQSNQEMSSEISDQNFQPMMKMMAKRRRDSPVACSAAVSPNTAIIPT